MDRTPHNSNTATTTIIIDALFASSSTSAGANDNTSLTHSLKPQHDTSPATSAVYAETSSRQTIITFSDRLTTANDDTVTTSTELRRRLASTATPMTRCSGSSADVISSTSASAAATTTRSMSHETATTPRTFEPFISDAGATTARLFTTSDNVGVTATTNVLRESHTHTHT